MKEFAAIIYLQDGMVYADAQGQTLLSEDALAYCVALRHSGVDGIVLHAKAGTSDAEEMTLHLIGDLCKQASLPVIVSWPLRKLEDVKKLLYAGCAKVLFDLEQETPSALLKEAAERFGADRMAARITGKDMFLECLPLIDKNVSLLLCDGEKVSMKGIPIPVLLVSDSSQPDRLGDLLSLDGVTGVACPFDEELTTTLPFLKESYEEIGMEVSSMKPAIPFSELKCSADGLIPVVTVEDATGDVLMVAYMNEEAYLETFHTGRMHYYSRSRKKLWLKGEESGHFQYVKSLTADCDKDTLLARVEQIGPACHTGAHSCFFETVYDETDKKSVFGQPATAHTAEAKDILERLYETILDRKAHPKEGSYTNYLFDKGLDKILKKFGEESAEVIIASKNAASKEVVYETADVLYHMLVLLAEKGITVEEVLNELSMRH